ncbi:hypothetical protein VSR01_37415 [Actinacidiphila sp. DG2A-62]|uniref:hypothetical protein n=1 Tax=Actinacidiphila sp. DG2A-62 TaxID=3108821 RepID=UPI002DBBC367|nr:hypothetical protein [Actinacidiphila sp. DG2A-62]MEC3998862.1 hypothetical protein [Actinacidiphila sp. DG2A-62]
MVTEHGNVDTGRVSLWIQPEPDHETWRFSLSFPPGQQREVAGLFGEHATEIDDLQGQAFRGSDMQAFVGLLAAAPAWMALASVVKAYLTRRKDQHIVVYAQDGKPRVEVTGDVSTEQIEVLLRAAAEASSMDAESTRRGRGRRRD